MAQKPNDPSYHEDRMPPDRLQGERRRLYSEADEGNRLQLEPVPSAAMRASGPFREEPPPERSVSRRNPKLTLAVIGGLIAIIALVVGMIFSGPTFVDESDTETPETMQFQAGR